MKILGISGRKQAGKNTTANILHGVVLKRLNNIEDWNIGASGELLVQTEGGWGEFDVTRQDRAFSEYAEYNMWPFVKLYSFADELKRICVELFNIPYECVFGTDEQKNQVQEHLLWENIPGATTNEGPMTAREFMQFFGTDVCRKMYEPIWVDSCIRKIQAEQSELAIIADVRFPNEAKAIERAGGGLLRLTRNIYDDDHSSEVALDDYPFTNCINNKDNSIDDLIVKVKEFYLNF
tara:strand:+ start:9431 stop:10138 length:708 start_codon:yes stop_codon:yes gene_type:complete